jgi:hypothetical protein
VVKGATTALSGGMVSHLHSKTFLELFCEQQGVAPEAFEHVVVEQSLHPQARALQNLLRMMPGDYFGADFELVRNVGKLTRANDFGWEVSDFHHHPANRNALRRRLKVRLSISRLRALVMRTFAEEAGRIRIRDEAQRVEAGQGTADRPRETSQTLVGLES